MGQGVKSNLSWVNIWLRRLAVQQSGRLTREFLDRSLAGTTDCLVGRHVNSLNSNSVVDWLERHQHADGGAVGVGDDASIAVVADRLRVDLRDH